MATVSVTAERRDRTAAGIGTMVLAMALVPLVDVQAKYLVTGGILALQVIFLRMLCGTALLLPAMLTLARHEIAPPQGWGNALLMGAFSMTGGACFFGALRYLPIADTVAISFVQPLFLIIFSRLFLAEQVTPIRWATVVIGFGASLLIIRPDFAHWDIGSLLALASGMAMAGYATVVKLATRAHRPASALALTFHTHLSGLAVGLPIVFAFWQWPDLHQWGLAIGMAIVGLIGQFLIIRAYQLADASIIAPFAYAEIVTSTAISWLIFADMPDLLTFVGVGILIGCSLAVYRSR